MTRTVELVAGGGTFFESPRWHAGRWYASDIFRCEVVSVAEGGGALETHARFGETVSGSDWLPGGSLLVVLRDRRRLAYVGVDGRIAEYASLEGYGRGLAGDMVIDRDRCAYVAVLGFDLGEFHALGTQPPPPGLLVRVDPDGYGAVAAEGLISPNGMVITANGSTLIVGETLAQRYTAFTIGPDGYLHTRRTWAEVAGRPDGCTLDACGRIWYADAAGSSFVLVAEGGAVVDTVALPSEWHGYHAYACMLGGSDGRTLLMCCAPPPDGQPRAGADSVLLSTRVEVPHAGCP